MIGNKATQVIDLINEKSAKQVRKIAPSVALGKVRSVSGATAQIVIDGDTEATPVAVFCPGLAAGKRVLVLRDKTQYYAIGVRQ